MVKRSDVDELFRVLCESRGGWNRRLLPGMVDFFALVTQVDDPDGDVPLLHALSALGSAVNAHQMGLLLDWQEAPLLEARCWDLVESTVGLPDEYWFEPDRFTKFAWEGSDVGQGLKAFDRWLVEDNVEFRGPDPWRIVNVDTGSDFYVVLLCDQNHVDVIAQLRALGMTGHLVNE